MFRLVSISVVHSVLNFNPFKFCFWLLLSWMWWASSVVVLLQCKNFATRSLAVVFLTRHPTAMAVTMALVGWQPSEVSKRTNSKSKARKCTRHKTYIFCCNITDNRTTSLSTSLRMMKLTDGADYWTLWTTNDGGSMTAAAVVQTVVGGPHTCRERGRQGT